MAHESPESIHFPILRVTQPIGEFYIASVRAVDLVAITEFDVRRLMMDEGREVERYLGIQRPLSQPRVNEIAQYVRTQDACFPTAVILAIDGRCVTINNGEMTLSNFMEVDDGEEPIYFRRIAKVLDGQHRLAGLKDLEENLRFDVNVSIFVDADISDQANIFSTVNLAQTKVSKSLAYDLYDLAKARSPQKLCHNIAVTLDREKDSPFYKRIKRLGVATPGRDKETLTQAAFVAPLLQFVSVSPAIDRDTYRRGRTPAKVEPKQLYRYPFQHLMIDEKDFEITDIMWNFFAAVRARWPNSWNATDRGNILNRTNGYRALMRFLKTAYFSGSVTRPVPTTEEFSRLLEKVNIDDGGFTPEKYLPGSGGEGALARDLIDGSGVPSTIRIVQDA